MLIGAALIAGMLIWSRGRTKLMEIYANRFSTLEAARPLIARSLSSRVPGAAVFIAPSADHVPPVLVHHVQRSRSLHETVILLTVQHAMTPVVAEKSRSQFSALGDGFYRLVMSFGYMEQPLLLPALEGAARDHGLSVNVAETTFYVGHESIVVRDEATINRIPEAIFSYLNRNAVHEDKRYGIPMEQVVEIGTQISVSSRRDSPAVASNGEVGTS
jgi:KUP system potassium uptake protein